MNWKKRFKPRLVPALGSPEHKAAVAMDQADTAVLAAVSSDWAEDRVGWSDEDERVAEEQTVEEVHD